MSVDASNRDQILPDFRIVNQRGLQTRASGKIWLSLACCVTPRSAVK